MKFGNLYLIRFIILGVINTILTYFLYLILLFLLPYVLAYSITYLFGLTITYFLSSYWVFKKNIAILGFSFKENIPDYRNTKVLQLVKEFQKFNINIKIFDSIVNKQDVFRDHDVKIYNFKELKNFKYDVIILAVSHKEFLKKINFYNNFYKNKKNKIFIDIKNNYLASDFEKNQYKFFQL